MEFVIFDLNCKSEITVPLIAASPWVFILNRESVKENILTFASFICHCIWIMVDDFTEIYLYRIEKKKCKIQNLILCFY